MARYIRGEENYFVCINLYSPGSRACNALQTFGPCLDQDGRGCFFLQTINQEQNTFLSLHINLGCRMGGIRLSPSLHTLANLGPVLIAKIRLQRIVHEVKSCVCLFLFDPNIKGRLNILFVSKISQMFVLLFSSWSSKVKFNLLN